MLAKLLTAIEKRCISRLGSTVATPTDAWVIQRPPMQTSKAWWTKETTRPAVSHQHTSCDDSQFPRNAEEITSLLAEYFCERYARKYQKEMCTPGKGKCC